jgi:histone-lysine N-methyltransferase SETD3
MYTFFHRGRPLSDFDYTRPISSANEATSLYSVIEAIKLQLSRYPQTEEEDADIIKDKALFRLLTYNQRMAVRHRRNEKRLLKRTMAALEKQIRSKGLDGDSMSNVQGNNIGQLVTGEEGGGKRRTALEERIAQMGLPVDWK